MEIAGIDPVIAWLDEHWPDPEKNPLADEWLLRVAQHLAVIATVAVCLTVVVGIILWVAVWFILNVLVLISGK
jgi:hypothetical protein